MSKPTAALRQVFAELDRLYGELPAIACKGKCSVACAAIVLTDAEARRLQFATHKKPRTVAGRCVYLTPDDRCSAYAVRPLICRAYGVVKMLSCPFGCVPDRWLRDVEFARLAQAIERLAGGRVLQTSNDGLFVRDTTFRQIGEPRRPESEIDADSERTRNLRALHGGRITLAVRTRT